MPHRPLLRLTLLALMALLAAGCALPAAPAASPSPARPAELTVFAAASLTEAFEQIGAEFESANPGVRVVFNFAGSQQLAQQIAQGAPADVFASANQAQMDAAVASGRIATDSVRVFAQNRLVVVTPEEAVGVITLADLAAPGVKVVLAAEAVPVGRYSLEFLDRASQDPALGADFRSRVEANVVSYEENVRAVLAKVALGEADAGIVYASDAVANPSSQVRQIAIPDRLNVLAAYPVAPLKDSASPELALAFVRALESEQARRTLAAYGFSLP